MGASRPELGKHLFVPLVRLRGPDGNHKGEAGWSLNDPSEIWAIARVVSGFTGNSGHYAAP
jgi:hypothetical protein